MEHLFNESFTVERKTRTPDGQGGFSETHLPTGDSFDGRKRPENRKAIEATNAGRREVTITHVVYGPLTVNYLKHDDHLIASHDGKRLRVIAVKSPSEPHHLKIDTEEVQNAA